MSLACACAGRLLQPCDVAHEAVLGPHGEIHAEISPELSLPGLNRCPSRTLKVDMAYVFGDFGRASNRLRASLDFVGIVIY